MPTVVLTGAGRGRGLELAREYAEEGWRVIATVRHAAAAAGFAKVRAETITVDIAKRAQVRQLPSRLQGVEIDLLFCNAGFSGKRGMALHSFDYAEREGLLRVNLLGAAAAIEALVENVAASERRTVAVMASGRRSCLLAGSLALRLAGRAIIVVALSPGWLAPEASPRGLRTLIAGLRQADSGSFLPVTASPSGRHS